MNNNKFTKRSVKIYPKVLIIGTPFNRITGGGITMSNLFQGWPKDRLALTSIANITVEADSLICENYFQLGYNGKLHPFPLNILLPKVYCGPVNISQSDNSDVVGASYKSGKFKKIYGLIKYILEFIGVYNLLYKVRITDEFKNWIIDLNPDIIYSQLSTYNSIQFVSTVAGILNKPVALHFMDDWINTLNKPGLMYFFWKKKTEKELMDLINRSYVLMSIGEVMSEEYKIRYNREFLPFHNPIDINRWLPYSKNNWSLGNRFTILYAGRIGLGTKYSVMDIARVVNQLNTKYENIYFEIQTPDFSELDGEVVFNNHVSYVKPLKYSKLPQKFAGVDLLIIPIDFDKRSIKFLKYSFLTKISEYMISGTPVLVYGPEETATVKYARKGGWGSVVAERNNSVLAKAILDLYSDHDLRRSLGEKAKRLASISEDSDIVRKKFRDCLTVMPIQNNIN